MILSLPRDCLAEINSFCTYRDFRSLRWALFGSSAIPDDWTEKNEVIFAPVERLKRHRWLSVRFAFMLRRKGWKSERLIFIYDNTARYSHLSGFMERKNGDPLFSFGLYQPSSEYSIGDMEYPRLSICSITGLVVAGNSENGISAQPIVTRVDQPDPVDFFDEQDGPDLDCHIYTPRRKEIRKLPRSHPWYKELKENNLKAFQEKLRGGKPAKKRKRQ